MQTILYLTDNSLEPELFEKCREVLLREAGDIPIVSSSQKPVDIGENICLGEIGRSWLSLYRQLLAGLDLVRTENVVICEHDCMYTHEHFEYEPKNPEHFFYNSNHWLVQWHGNHPELEGMYSHWPKRTALSQLVCRADLLRKATEDVMRLLDMGLKVDKGLHWYGEPGVVSEQFRKAFVMASSGRSAYLQTYLREYVEHYHSEFFRTVKPNLDIRHQTNFTGPKRGKSRTFDLPYWGKFSEVMHGSY